MCARLGNAQNFARELAEAPANFLTPTQFVEEAARGLAGLNVRQGELAGGSYPYPLTFYTVVLYSIFAAYECTGTVPLYLYVRPPWCW